MDHNRDQHGPNAGGIGTAAPGRDLDKPGSPGRQAGRLSDVADELRRDALDLKDEAVHRGTQLMDTVQERVSGAVEGGKNRLADEISGLGSSLKQACDATGGEQHTGNLARMAADQINSLGDYLRETSPQDMVRGIESFARRRPELFLGGMLVAGLMAGRFLRSHAPRHESDQAPQGTDGFDRFGAYDADGRDDDVNTVSGIGPGIGAAASGIGAPRATGGSPGYGSSGGMGAGGGMSAGSDGSTGSTGFAGGTAGPSDKGFGASGGSGPGPGPAAKPSTPGSPGGLDQCDTDFGGATPRTST